MIAAYPDDLELCWSADDIEAAFAAGHMASLLGMEGGHVLEGSLGALRAFHELGDHVEHVARVAGHDHVGIGADYDGNRFWPAGMEDVSSYPVLFAELIRRGWTDAQLAALAGGNVLRVMREAEAVASAPAPALPGS